MGRELSREEYLVLWAEEASAFKASGLSQQEWCSQTGISVNTFRYHLRALREAENGNKLSFVKVNPGTFAAVNKKDNLGKDSAEDSSITIELNGVKIGISNCTKERLQVVLEAAFSCSMI